MKKRTVRGLIVGAILCVAAGGVFLFIYLKDHPGSKKPAPGKAGEIRRKLAFTGDPEKNMELAQKYEAEGDFDRALYHYQFLAKSLPERDMRKGWASYKEAFCYYQKGNYPLAKLTLEYALNKDPEMPSIEDALFLMAEIYARLREFDKADKTYNTIIRLFAHRAAEAKALQKLLPQYQTDPQKTGTPQPSVVPNP